MDINNLNYILALNKQGIIPGPEESLEFFSERSQYCLSLKGGVENFFDEKVPLSFVLEPLPSLELYDLSPTWVPIFYSNHELSIWQGGSAWIFQKEEDASKGAFIQLRCCFAKRNSWLYDKEELLSHELSHVGRLAFDEPKFEEFLAYRTSKFCFRRFFGPIVKSSKEALCFVLSLSGIVFLEMMALFLSDYTFYHAVNWLKLWPAFLVMLAFLRLSLRHYQLNRSLKQLEGLTGLKTIANAILYRLTDAEIISFGKMSVSEIRSYISEQTSPRWIVIRGAYLDRLQSSP